MRILGLFLNSNFDLEGFSMRRCRLLVEVLHLIFESKLRTIMLLDSLFTIRILHCSAVQSSDFISAWSTLFIMMMLLLKHLNFAFTLWGF